MILKNNSAKNITS